MLADTGPLVAMLSPSDIHHESCVEAAKQIAPPLLTSWPVIAEAAWLLRGRPVAVDHLLDLIEIGAIEVLDLDKEAVKQTRRILNRYRSPGPQLADATLVYFAEREKIETIFTLDRRDFRVFRTRRGRAFRLVPEM